MNKELEMRSGHRFAEGPDGMATCGRCGLILSASQVEYAKALPTCPGETEDRGDLVCEVRLRKDGTFVIVHFTGAYSTTEHPGRIWPSLDATVTDYVALAAQEALRRLDAPPQD